jgi:hypothetical protein
MRHYEEVRPIPASAADVFALIDDHTRLSAHMSKSSWMMGGGKMDIAVDEGGGRRVGSHIKLSGTAFGIHVALDEVVTAHEPPRRKAWETVGEPRLLIIGAYKMAVAITPQSSGSTLQVSIDYEPLRTFLGVVFGDAYAKWCVRRMLNDAAAHFALPAQSPMHAR